MSKVPPDNAVLCYVHGQAAFFTTQNLDKQWGDDWNDAPYEHNAGHPYGPCWHNEPHRRNDLCRCESCVRDWNEDGTPKWGVWRVMFDGPWETPADMAYSGNSRYSVEMINAGAIAWLTPSESDVPVIPAGMRYDEFRRIVVKHGTLYESVAGEEE